jgi:hypothetical protein
MIQLMLAHILLDGRRNDETIVEKEGNDSSKSLFLYLFEEPVKTVINLQRKFCIKKSKF